MLTLTSGSLAELSGASESRTRTSNVAQYQDSVLTLLKEKKKDGWLLRYLELGSFPDRIESMSPDQNSLLMTCIKQAGRSCFATSFDLGKSVSFITSTNSDFIRLFLASRRGC